MKEILIKRDKNTINIILGENNICSVSLDNKTINGASLYNSYNWSFDDDYKLSDSSKPLEKPDSEKTSLDFLHENVYTFFSSLITRIEEEKKQTIKKTKQYSDELSEKNVKIETIISNEFK